MRQNRENLCITHTLYRSVQDIVRRKVAHKKIASKSTVAFPRQDLSNTIGLAVNEFFLLFR